MKPGPNCFWPTGRAARFVQLLQDFGHLSAEASDTVLLGGVEFEDQLLQGVLPLDDAKRMAAVLLFVQRSGSEEGVLSQDWPILFS